jgi:hypothetical protein
MFHVDRLTLQKQKRLNLILKFLEKSEMGEEGHDSTQKPFFIKGGTHEFTQGYGRIPDVPEGLNRNFRDMYEIIGNPSVEITVKTTDKYPADWTVMSVSKALEVYSEYSRGGQTSVFDIAYTYMGMGHINILACDLNTHNLFVHLGGGSNGWDREYNHEKILKYKRDEYEQFYFTDWLRNYL